MRTGTLCADLDDLLGLLLAEATHLLRAELGFHPFGARRRTGHDHPELVRPVSDEADVAAERVMAEMLEALRMDAAAGDLVAAGLCADVRVTIPDEGEREAVRVALEHRDGTNLVAYLLYRWEADNPIFDDMVTTPGTRTVFGA